MITGLRRRFDGRIRPNDHIFPRKSVQSRYAPSPANPNKTDFPAVSSDQIKSIEIHQNLGR